MAPRALARLKSWPRLKKGPKGRFTDTSRMQTSTKIAIMSGM